MFLPEVIVQLLPVHKEVKFRSLATALDHARLLPHAFDGITSFMM